MVLFIRSVLILTLLAANNPLESQALTIDASITEMYETNINPLLSASGSPCGNTDSIVRNVLSGVHLDADKIGRQAAAGTGTSDFHTILSADAQASTEVGPETEVSLKGEIARDQFNRFTDLNLTRFTLSAGLFKQFSDMNSFRIGLSAGWSLYEANALDADTRTGTFDLIQQLTPRLWLDETLVYEKNYARNGRFSFDGRSAGIRAGYGVAERFIATCGFSFHEKTFDGGLELAIHAVKVSGVREIGKNSHVLVSYERQSYRSEPVNTRARNAIYSLGLGFSY